MEKAVAFSKKKKKNKVRNTGFIIAISILSILLIASNLFFFLGVYSKFNLNGRYPVNILGDNIIINISENASMSSTLSFEGTKLQGVNHFGKISAKMNNSSKPVFLRVKYSLIKDNSSNLLVRPIIDSHWVAGNDDYYYYLLLVNKGEKITLSNGCVLPYFNADQDLSYFVNVNCETLRSDLDVKKIWDSAPKDWLKSLESLLNI